MNVGTVAAGRIGTAVLRRLKPFDVKLHYTDRHRLPDTVEKELALRSGQLASYAGDDWFPQPAPRASRPGMKSPQGHRPNQCRHRATYHNCRR